MSPETFAVENNGVMLRGLCYGPTDAPPVLLAHGIRDLAWGLTPISEALAAHYRVIVPDLRGHGDSDNPGCYTLPHFVADVHAIVTQLQLNKPVLIGHSLGGQILARYAALFPEKVTAIVIAEGMGPPLLPAQSTDTGRRESFRRQLEMLMAPIRPLRPMPDLEDATARLQRNHPKLSPLQARFLAEKGTSIQADGTLLWKWAPEVGSIWSSVDHTHNELAWSWIECPALIVTAAQSLGYWISNGISTEMSDAHFQSEIERRLKLFKNATHQWIADSGHMLHYDQPSRFSSVLLDFLKRVL